MFRCAVVLFGLLMAGLMNLGSCEYWEMFDTCEHEEMKTEDSGMSQTCKCSEPVCEKACFTYDNSCFGPRNWARITKCWEKCGCDKQTPVNIVTAKTVLINTLIVNIQNLDTQLKAKIENKGVKTAFKVVSKVSQRPRLTNVPNQSGNTFIMDNFHVHIGKMENIAVGSEHSVDGTFSLMELHAVFYNDKYANVDEAANKTDGLTVLGVLVQFIFYPS